MPYARRVPTPACRNATAVGRHEPRKSPLAPFSQGDLGGFEGYFLIKIKLLTKEIDFDISGVIDKRVFRVLDVAKIINEKGG